MQIRGSTTPALHLLPPVLIRRATGEIAAAGTSPLHYACSRFGTEYLPIVALLLRCGASTLAVDTSGCTPCDVASNPVTSAMVCAHAYRLSGSISASSSAHNSAFRGRHSAASAAADATSAHSHSSHSNYSGGAAAAAAGAQQQQLGIVAYRTAKEVNWSLQAATCHWDGCGSYELWRYIVRCAAAVRCAANTAALTAKDSAKQRSKKLSKHSRELLIMQSERLAGARAHCEELSNSSASAATSSVARHYSTSTWDSVSSVLTSAAAAGATATAAGVSGDKQSAVAATEKLVSQLERAVHAAQHRAPNKLEEVMMSALTDSRRAKAVHWWCATADNSTRTSAAAAAAAAAHASSISSSRNRDSAAAAAVDSDNFAAAAAAAAEAAVRSLSTATATSNDSVSGYANDSSVSGSKYVGTTDTAADTTADTTAATTRGSTGDSSGKIKRRTWWPTVPLENAPAPPPLILDVVPHPPQRRSYAATAQLRCTRDLAAVEAAVATVMTWTPRVILDLIVPAGWGSDSGESAWCSLKSERASLDARKATLVAAASDTEQRYKMVSGTLSTSTYNTYHKSTNK
jgi:hypothetical protein